MCYLATSDPLPQGCTLQPLVPFSYKDLNTRRNAYIVVLEILSKAFGGGDSQGSPVQMTRKGLLACLLLPDITLGRYIAMERRDG